MLVIFFQVVYFLTNHVFNHFYKIKDENVDEDIKNSTKIDDDNFSSDNNDDIDFESEDYDFDDHSDLEYFGSQQFDFNMSNERGNLKRRCSDESVDEKSSTIRFNPPAYLQRYQAVQKILNELLKHQKIEKVVDFGCAELQFCVYLKNLLGVKDIFFVDIDRDTLERHQIKARPLNIDYIHRKTTPLKISIFEGSVNHHDKLLENTDAVVCIELIEHLYPEDLTNFPYSVFGFIQPKIAIVTTPNADFNVLFDNMTGFRHWDHKFEWTRSQFEDWANNIVTRFPDYQVTFHGISYGPPGTENLGACSQMAVFYKIGNPTIPKIAGTEGLFKIVTAYEYPVEIDDRTDEQKILDDAVYCIKRMSVVNEEMEEEIPLYVLIDVMKTPITEDNLKEVLQNNNWSIENRDNGPVVIVPPPTQFSNESQDPDNINNFNDIDSDDFDDDEWGRDPGPPANFYSDRTNGQFNDLQEDENWSNDAPVNSVDNVWEELSAVRNENVEENWGNDAPINSEGNIWEDLSVENDNTESSNLNDETNSSETNRSDLDTLESNQQENQNLRDTELNLENESNIDSKFDESCKLNNLVEAVKESDSDLIAENKKSPSTLATESSNYEPTMLKTNSTEPTSSSSPCKKIKITDHNDLKVSKTSKNLSNESSSEAIDSGYQNSPPNSSNVVESFLKTDETKNDNLDNNSKTT